MEPAEKLSITLPSEMARMVRAKVDTGNYSSNSEVIREALRDSMEREKRLSALDAAIAKGIADCDAGHVQDIKTIREELRKHFAL